jgi:cell pole-organizing protein PopZ
MQMPARIKTCARTVPQAPPNRPAQAEVAAKSGTTKNKAAAKRSSARPSGAEVAAKADAAKNKAAAKRSADRTARLQEKQYKDRQQMFYSAVYNSLTGVGLKIPATPANYAHSRWAVVGDVCDHCRRPRKSCMCI